MIPGYLTVTEAAVRLGRSASRTYELVASGALASERAGRAVLIPVASIDAYIEERERERQAAKERTR